MIVRESIEFKRIHDTKKSLKLGLREIIKKILFEHPWWKAEKSGKVGSYDPENDEDLIKIGLIYNKTKEVIAIIDSSDQKLDLIDIFLNAMSKGQLDVMKHLLEIKKISKEKIRKDKNFESSMAYDLFRDADKSRYTGRSNLDSIKYLLDNDIIKIKDIEKKQWMIFDSGSIQLINFLLYYGYNLDHLLNDIGSYKNMRRVKKQAGTAPRGSLGGVYHEDEISDLFDYIKELRKKARKEGKKIKSIR